MTQFPQADTLDAALPLARDPYRWIARTAAENHGTFEARLLLKPTVFLSGHDGARFFYSGAFRRSGAAPGFLKKGLFGEGGVQGLDDAAHRHRKALFLDIVGPDHIAAITAEVAEGLAGLAQSGKPMIYLQDEMAMLLTRAVCNWAGIPIAEKGLADRALTLSHLFEHAAPTGPSHLRARIARAKANRWIAGELQYLRAGQRKEAPDKPAMRIAFATDLAGEALPLEVAAVEMLNILRPVVAISVFATFCAHALHRFPHSRDALKTDKDIASFVQEVRRFYPFFPMIAAVADRNLDHAGGIIPEGCRVVLDIYGTNHDPRLWPEPDTFHPARFDGWRSNPFSLIPQGGGDYATGHRCPGEFFTIAILQQVVRWLVQDVAYDVPTQDLRLDMTALPALPKSRMVLHDLRARVIG
jgi:fatty-acid peroxygenase